MFYSHSFHVTEAIKTNFSLDSALKRINKVAKKQEKITNTSIFQSMRATFATLTLICISYFV